MLFLKVYQLALVTVAITLLPISATASSTCNFEENSISLEIINKPLREVLKDIEKQTDLKFEVHDNKALNVIKSIILKDCPLDETLSRVFKGVNYSIICSDKQKSLSVIFLDKDDKTYAISTDKEIDYFLNAMKELDITLENYDQNISANQQPIDLGEPPEELRGLEEAVENYSRSQNNKSANQQPIDLGEPPEELRGLEEAVENYYRSQNNKSANQQPIDLGEPPEELKGLEEAVENYSRSQNNQSANQQPIDLGEPPEELRGLEEAVENYYRLQNKEN